MIALISDAYSVSETKKSVLKKVMTWRLIGIFFGTVALMIMLLGWTFNVVL